MITAELVGIVFGAGVSVTDGARNASRSCCGSDWTADRCDAFASAGAGSSVWEDKVAPAWITFCGAASCAAGTSMAAGEICAAGTWVALG